MKNIHLKEGFVRNKSVIIVKVIAIPIDLPQYLVIADVLMILILDSLSFTHSSYNISAIKIYNS